MDTSHSQLTTRYSQLVTRYSLLTSTPLQPACALQYVAYHAKNRYHRTRVVDLRKKVPTSSLLTEDKIILHEDKSALYEDKSVLH